MTFLAHAAGAQDTRSPVPRGAADERARDGWLDLLRAVAILMVLVYHGVQMAPHSMPRAWMIAQHGRWGVDLFFVLSGWLIGSLYWKEQTRGRVDLMRFWQRRWLRTIPAYAVALALSWGAVAVARAEPFDWTYLVFLQNYRDALPYFLVSWSLCVEEHAYLLLPVLVRASPRVRVSPQMLFGVLLAVPLAARHLQADAAVQAPFGFHHTATHVQLTGIVMGFWASHLRILGEEAWPTWQGRIRSARVPCAIVAVTSLDFGGRFGYVLSSTAVAAFFLAVLVGGVERRAVRAPTVLRWLAVTSYSLYLTHALVIHVARAVAQRVEPSLQNPVYFLAGALLIAGTGALFYMLVERPSLWLRERVAPRSVPPGARSSRLELVRMQREGERAAPDCR